MKKQVIEVVNIKQKLSLFSDYWSPKIVEELNGQEIKVAKLKGEFIWHHHKNEDELFFVVKGNLLIHFRDKDINLTEGECIVIPKMVEHRPEAIEEAHIILIEPKGTMNTGNVVSEHTVKNQKKI